MKRLIRKASQVFYHGTCVEYLRDITNDGGLIPNKSKGAGGNINQDGSNFGGFVFLATTEEKALSFATYIPPHQTEAYVVLEVSCPEDRLFPDDDDDPNATSWQDSVNSIQQVKFDGTLESNNFIKVSFYEPTTSEFKFEAPFIGWEEFYDEFGHLLKEEE